MKEAMHYKAKEKQSVQCLLCPNLCEIEEGDTGTCRVRKNIKGKLYSMNYGKPISVCIDPIEKKPLFHFLPGSTALSFGTLGCNLQCEFCQNWDISTASYDDEEIREMTPEQLVEIAEEKKCQSIAYTYNEPTIFFEFILETAKLARKKGIRNIMVSNGFINLAPMKELYEYIDAVNIDLKGFNEDFYKNITHSKLQPVLNTIKHLSKSKTFLEVTNLIIPEKNDDMKEIEELCKWVKENAGNVPLHFSRFFPQHKMQDIMPTPEDTLMKAREIAKKYLDHVYVGNIVTRDGENTHCSKCGELLIERYRYDIMKNNIEEGKCKFCKESINGVWK